MFARLQLFQLIAIDLNKYPSLDAGLKAIQQINFTGNLSGNNNRSIMLY